MTISRREIPFFMPILEGNIPAQWVIWGKTFQRICRDFEESPRPLPGSYKHLDVARLQINLQTPEELFNRTPSQWSRFVGILVDGDSHPSIQQTVFDRILQFWSRAQCANAIYEKLERFTVGILLPNRDALNQSVRDFAYTIERDGTTQLNVKVEPRPITTSAGFIDMMHSIEWQLVRDWMNRKRAVP